MFKSKIVKIILSILVIIAILALLYIDNKFIFQKIVQGKKFEKSAIEIYEMNKEPVFRVSKIIKYSSAEAIDNSSQQNLQDVSIHQYSDMAFYIDNLSDELTEKNTIKELYLDNFKIDVGYNKGEHILYYKNPLTISKFRMIPENEIKDKLNYQIIYTNKDNEESNYETPVFFADCSNPITLSFVNKNIVENYKVTKENGLVSFDGRMLNNLDIDLDELSPKISFIIHIKNNLDEVYSCNVSANMKLETKDGSVKSGYIIEIEDDIGYYNFYREA